MTLSVSEKIRRDLFDLADPSYKAFHARLIPTVDPERIIGVRTPALRKLAKRWSGDDAIGGFLAELPHRYYEENNVHGEIIGRYRDFAALIDALDAFLPYVDNWATCDMLRPALFKKRPEGLLPVVYRWLEAEHPYTVRFGVSVLMTYYLDDGFDAAFLEKAATLRREEYYIKMMVAWYFATALAKRYEDAVPFLEKGTLDPWTHNKAIQKARESYRVSDEHKAYLKTLKRK